MYVQACRRAGGRNVKQRCGLFHAFVNVRKKRPVEVEEECEENYAL
jgi:hypothetical protein